MKSPTKETPNRSGTPAEPPGFLMLEPTDEEFTFQGREEDFPEEWLEETKSGSPAEGTYRRHRPERRIASDEPRCRPVTRHGSFPASSGSARLFPDP